MAPRTTIVSFRRHLIFTAPLSQWGKSELFQQSIKWLPQRTESSSRQAVSDPFRCILFDDIKPFLIEFSSMDAKKKLMQSFIQFLYGGMVQLGLGEAGWAFTRCRDPSLHPFTSVLGKTSSFGIHKTSNLEGGRLFSRDEFPSGLDIGFLQSLGVGWVDFLKRVLDLMSVFDESSSYLVAMLALETLESAKGYVLNF
jgi:hypothetical protein